MHKMTLRFPSALVLAGLASTAGAAGFQLWEQNASGLGVAYAGSAAVADNAGTIFFNPAGMTQLPGLRLSVGVAGVGPSFKFKDDGSSGTGPLAGLAGSNGGDAGGWSAVPNGYVSWQLAPQWFVGLGVSAPFGLSTKYEDDAWIGRFNSRKAEIKTVNVNPTVAYRLNDKVSLGFGLNYQRIDAEITNAAPGAASFSRLKGDDSAWGWNAGALFTLSPAMRVGVSYRSSVQYTIEGDASTAVATNPAKAKLELPDTFVLSVWQQVSDRWEAMGDLSYTHWSTLQSLNVINRSTGAILSSEPFGYQNSWRFAWGAAYRVNDAWKTKFGVAYDRTPTTNGDRSARVPDNNRIWLSLGAQWKPAANAVVDVGYAYLYLQDPKVNSTKTFAPGVSANLHGSYSDSGHVLGVQYSQGF